MCIRLPDWPLERIRIERPELKGKPIVLDETHRGSRRVRACSAEAEDLGVTVGMPSAEAAALAGFATTCLEAYDPSGDREALEELAEWCGRFSPLVGLDHSPAPDSLILDITGLAHLFGGEGPLAERVVHEFAQRRLVVRVAIADTIGAAWAVAHFGQRGKSEGGRGEKGLQIEDCKLQIANWFNPAIPQFSICNFQFAICNSQSLPSPSAFIIPPDEASTALRPLPVEALRLPGDVVELLHQLGIYSIGQLESLPRVDLTSRFGPLLLERWDQATGRLGEPVSAHPVPPKLHARRSLEHPTTRRETIEHLLEQLIREVADRLVRSGRGALRLDCRLDCHPEPGVELRGDCPNFRAAKMGLSPSQAHGVDLSVGLFQPTASPRHLFELVLMQLERVYLPSPVSAVHVEAAVTAPFERRQEDLFADGRHPTRPRQLAGLVDRLTSRLGRKSVLRARLVRDAQPELAVRYDPLVDSSPTRNSRRGLGGTGVSPVRVRSRDGQAVRSSTGKMPVAPWRGKPATRSGLSRKQTEAELPPRPLRLIAPPVPLAAVSIMPDGPPLRFHFHGRQHRIVYTWGPERIETGWWRGRPLRRDYYRVQTTTGRRYWLFRRLDDGQWFLHGIFE